MKNNEYYITKWGIAVIVITFLITIFLLGHFIWQKIPRYEIVETITSDVYGNDFCLITEMLLKSDIKECYCEEVEFDCKKPCMTFEATDELEEVIDCSETEICSHKTICYIKEKIRIN